LLSLTWGIGCFSSGILVPGISLRGETSRLLCPEILFYLPGNREREVADQIA